MKFTFASAAMAAMLFAAPLAFAQAPGAAPPEAPAGTPAPEKPMTPPATPSPASPGSTIPEKMAPPAETTEAPAADMMAGTQCKTRKSVGSKCACKSDPSKTGMAKKDEGMAHTMCVVE